MSRARRRRPVTAATEYPTARDPRPSTRIRDILLAAIVASAVVAPAVALRAGAIVAAVLVLVSAREFRVRSADILAVCLVVLTWSSMAWTLASDVTMSWAADQTAVVVLFLAVRASVTKARSFVIVAGSLVAACAFAVHLQGGLTLSVPGDSLVRAGIAGQNVNYLAYSLATGLSILVMLWGRSVRRAVRLAMVSASVLILFGILRTGTRGAWLSVGLLVVWLVVSRVARHRRVLPALYVAIAAACIATVTGQFDRFVVPYLDRSLRDTGDLNGRLYMWPFARDLLTDHLVFGAGAGTFRAVNPLGISAHNALLEIGSGLGLLGIALFLGVAVRALVKETAMTDEVSRNRKLGAFLIVSTPILLSGVWEQSAVAWVAMALASRMAMSPGAAPKEQVQSPRERQPPRHPPQTTVSEPPGVRGLRSPQSLHSGT